ncbi:MAG: Gfo/Idh/MocA family oxidoreductase, partial [Candidatus Hydrogenedentes bacterium]|nr:Gfo/Idh/MocA family oxidoreductase [Candidatus Hydrogenedentota bacterium]
MSKKSDNGISRRDFAKASAAAAGVAILSSKSGIAEDNTDTLKIGLIGCGGRGSGAAVNCLTGNDNIKLVALADVFGDKLSSSRKALEGNRRINSKVDIKDDMCFVGLDAYQQLLKTDVDVVIHATPPYARPMHIEAIIASGKHLFSEKPFAVDAPGIRRCIAAAKAAKKNGQVFVTGLQRR